MFATGPDESYATPPETISVVGSGFQTVLLLAYTTVTICERL